MAALIVMLPVAFAQGVQMTDGVGTKSPTKAASTDGTARPTASAQAATSAAGAFIGLPAFLVSLLSTAGIAYILVGAAVVLFGWVIFHAASTAWVWYTAYRYSQMSEHAYKHINHFPNIWKTGPPSRKQLEQKCKETINSKSMERYIDTANGRFIGYNRLNQMYVVGETDGKTIVSCERIKPEDLQKKLDKLQIKRIR